MKAIKEVTYYCKKCEVPLADDYTRMEATGTKVKNGNLVCLNCGKVIVGEKEYI